MCEPSKSANRTVASINLMSLSEVFFSVREISYLLYESSPRTRRASHATSSRGDLAAKAGVGDAAFRGDESGEAFSSVVTRFSRSLSRFSTLWSCCWPHTVVHTARITLDASSGDFMRARVTPNHDWTNLRKITKISSRDRTS